MICNLECTTQHAGQREFGLVHFELLRPTRQHAAVGFDFSGFKKRENARLSNSEHARQSAGARERARPRTDAGEFLVFISSKRLLD